MAIFKIEDFTPVPNDEFFMIEEFGALFKLKYNEAPGDKQGRQRLRGTAEARFLYFYCDHKSEFAKFSLDERRIESLVSAGLPEDHPISKTLEAAITRYEKLNNSRNIRLLKGANAAVDKLAQYFEGVDFTQKDNNNNLVYDPKDLITNVGNLGKVIEGLEKLREAVMKDEGQESTTRGQAEKGRLA